MFEVKGKNGSAKIFTDFVEETALSQIVGMLNSEITKGTNLAIMPDVHAGAGATIGTTILLGDDRESWKVSPNVVGVDIGCGMLSYKLSDKKLNLNYVDEQIVKHVPVGHEIHEAISKKNYAIIEDMLKNLSFRPRSLERIYGSIGTLGGGNHFIEISVDEDGFNWLTVHSGSRSLGTQVARHHQSIAESNSLPNSKEREDLIKELSKQGRHKEIQSKLEELSVQQKSRVQSVGELAFIEGEALVNYLNDMSITQSFAAMNRQVMLDAIVNSLGLDVIDSFDSVHNFIDIEAGIIRKGATSSNEGERLLIPLNMRDGSLICVGKGSKNWNYSAPHGAGRVLSRSQARKVLSLEEYTESMEGIYSSSLSQANIDESPMAYKPIESILDNIGDTVEVLHHLKPIYNRKG